MTKHSRGARPQFHTNCARTQTGRSTIRPLAPRQRLAFTLVEMLVAMSLTLLMMATVIGVFASISESVANRRATIEMSGAMRYARTVLQADLAGATCPATPWQRPESNHGYLEIIEGPQSDFDPSIWLRDQNNDGIVDAPIAGRQLDLASSQLPGSSLNHLPGSTANLGAGAKTDGGALGDWDDTLMLTVRNEQQPFVGRVPDPATVGNAFNMWGVTETQSQLAEVVWFAVENPVEADRTFYFGEPGFRTVYRRALLIAPWLDFGFVIDGVETGPGVVRVLSGNLALANADQAVAALIAFQELYDLSVRLEWDSLLDGGRWVIKANTLADLTKRENRYEHVDLTSYQSWQQRFPHRVIAAGDIFGATPDLTINVESGLAAEMRDYEEVDGTKTATNDQATATATLVGEQVLYQHDNNGSIYGSRPYVYMPNQTGAPTVRAIMNELGQVVGYTAGMVPLGGNRRGQDVMLSNMLAFDIKVYDPEAPVLAEIPDTSNAQYPGDAIAPSSAAWGVLALDQFGATATPAGGAIISRGAYVDLGYVPLHAAFIARNAAFTSKIGTALQENLLLGNSTFALGMSNAAQLGKYSVATGEYAFAPYRTYDTWSTSYENNGVDEDGVSDATQGIALQSDEGTDGFDSTVFYDDDLDGNVDTGELDQRFGVDDPTERETAPPYETSLRGVQITLRGYELDSRQIREVNVKQTFVPK